MTRKDYTKLKYAAIRFKHDNAIAFIKYQIDILTEEPSSIRVINKSHDIYAATHHPDFNEYRKTL